MNRCSKCGRTEHRSSGQNRLYWSLLHEIADKVRPGGKGYSAEVWHELFKQKILGAEDVELPNGKVISRSRSTTSLDKAEMAEYVTKIEAWAAHRGIYGEQDE